MLSDRELASLIWLVAIGLFAARFPGVRGSFGQVLRLLLSRTILAILGLFFVWTAVIICVMWSIGLWNPTMLKDTLLWGVVGVALVMKSTNASNEPQFFRRHVGRAIGLTAFAEFYLNLANLGLIPELIAQPLLTLATIAPVVLPPSKENDPGLRLWAGIRTLLVLLLFIAPAAHLIVDRTSIDWAETGRSYLLPIWLTLWSLPSMYVLSVYSGYEQLFMHMSFANDRRRAPIKVKLAIFTTFHLRNHDLNSFAGDWPRRLVKADGFRAARKVIEDHRIECRADEVAAKREADNLVKYAGVEGTDVDGRQLDRREFHETARALEWLHTMQMGWFNREGRYRTDPADAFSDAWSRRGLPEDLGIKIEASRSGHSWFGWRRTPSGWCLAVGASGPTPDEWYYDGPEPPTTFPGKGKGNQWAEEPFEFTLNWPGYEPAPKTGAGSL